MYRIEFSKQASKQFKALPVNIQKRFQLKIDGLQREPRPSSVIKLAGEEGLYRLRVGN